MMRNSRARGKRAIMGMRYRRSDRGLSLPAGLREDTPPLPALDGVALEFDYVLGEVVLREPREPDALLGFGIHRLAAPSEHPEEDINAFACFVLFRAIHQMDEFAVFCVNSEFRFLGGFAGERVRKRLPRFHVSRRHPYGNRTMKSDSIQVMNI